MSSFAPIRAATSYSAGPTPPAIAKTVAMEKQRLAYPAPQQKQLQTLTNQVSLILTPPPTPPQLQLQPVSAETTPLCDRRESHSPISSSPPRTPMTPGFAAWLRRARHSRGSDAGLPTAGSVTFPLASPTTPTRTVNNGDDDEERDASFEQLVCDRYVHALEDFTRSWQIQRASVTGATALQPSMGVASNSSSSGNDMSLAERHLRRLTLVHPLPTSQNGLRRRLWRALLLREGDFIRESHQYAPLMMRGPSSHHSLIQRDLSKLAETMANVQQPMSEVARIKIIDALGRILNALVHRLEADHDSIKSYVQGLHLLALPFVKVLREDEAYSAFYIFITKRASVYARQALDGVQCAVELLDECLRAVDRTLYDHLLDHGIFPERYAYDKILSCTACVQSAGYDDHLRLWDVVLAYGIHMNVLCVVAQLIETRQVLLSSSDPLSVLLDETVSCDINRMIDSALSISRQLPPELYRAFVRHANDVTVRDMLPLIP